MCSISGWIMCSISGWMCAPSVDASLSLVIGCMGAPTVDDQFLVHKVWHMPYAYIRLCKSVCVCGGGGRSLLIFVVAVLLL